MAIDSPDLVGFAVSPPQPRMASPAIPKPGSDFPVFPSPKEPAAFSFNAVVDIQEGLLVLVLTRKPGESVIVAGNIRITVVDIGHGRVKLGIEAPGLTIDREEIHERRVAEAATPQVVETPANPPLHNRIADKLPPTPSERQFPPRKPR